MSYVVDMNRCVWQLFNIKRETVWKHLHVNIASFPKTLCIMIISGLSYLPAGHNKKIIGPRINVSQTGPRRWLLWIYIL